MTNLPPAASALLCALSADPTDRERVLTWATCGFNCAAASRARPDLGSPDAFEDTRNRHAEAIAALIQTHLREYRSAA